MMNVIGSLQPSFSDCSIGSGHDPLRKLPVSLQIRHINGQLGGPRRVVLRLGNLAAPLMCNCQIHG